MQRGSTGSAPPPTCSPSRSPRSSARPTALPRRATTSSGSSRCREPSTDDYTRGRLAEAVAATRTEEVQWTKCPSCDAFVYHKRLRRNLGVCPECNYHFRLPVRQRLEQLLDEGSFEE